MEPEAVYKKFENDLIKQLPTDNPDFMAELEREGVIDEETKKKINLKKRFKFLILDEIEKSLDDPDKKFYKLLKAMENYKHGLETLAEKMRNHLDPGTYIHINFVYSLLYIHSNIYICMYHEPR